MRVWVTRSEPGAQQLCLALSQLGVPARTVCAVEIKALDPPQLSRFDRAKPGHVSSEAEQEAVTGIELCIVVSRHAARLYRGSAYFDARRKHLAIGQATGSALGTEFAVPEEASTEGLLEHPLLADCTRVMIAAGVAGREDLITALTDNGITVYKLELYERVAGNLATLTPAEGDIIEIGSGFGLDVVDDRLRDIRQGVDLVVPSQRVGDLALRCGYPRVRVARSAAVADVVAAVASTYSQKE